MPLGQLVGVNDADPRQLVKAKALHRALGFNPVAGGWIDVLELADHMGGGDAEDIAGIDIQDRQPNGMALGMDHLDAADQFGPMAASPDRNQLARAEVHGTRLVQTLKLVRLACIDAPETAQTPFGVASRNQLKALLPLGSPVSLRVQAVDRYGRTLAELVGKGPINLVMVQAQRLGVWAVPGGIRRPLDFRPGGGGERRSGTMPQTATSSAPASSPQDSQPGGAKTTCKQIGSYARAQELLRQGHRTLDRNGDGVACEWLR